jgi:hypothetical protein
MTKKTGNPRGRPSSYRRDLAARICLEIATTQRGLKDICDQNADFPDPRTVYRWLSLKEEFRQMYARAKEDQIQILADEIIPIADTVQMGCAARILKPSLANWA